MQPVVQNRSRGVSEFEQFPRSSGNLLAGLKSVGPLATGHRLVVLQAESTEEMLLRKQLKAPGIHHHMNMNVTLRARMSEPVCPLEVPRLECCKKRSRRIIHRSVPTSQANTSFHSNRILDFFPHSSLAPDRIPPTKSAHREALFFQP